MKRENLAANIALSCILVLGLCLIAAFFLSRKKTTSAMNVVNVFSPESDLNFYGFRIGDSLNSSTQAMAKRDLVFVDLEQYAKNLGSGRKVFIDMETPNRCEEMNNANGMRVVACYSNKGDVQAFGLLFLDDVLVRITANFKGDGSDSALAKVKEKYGNSEVEIGPDRVASMEAAVSLSPLLQILANPFGMDKTCGGCKLTEFPQHLKDDHVYLRRDGGALSFLTLFNDQVLDKAAKSYDARAERELASEKEKTSF